MNLSKFFIDRPIFAGVISVLMVLAGLVNKTLVRSLQRASVPAVGLAGADALQHPGAHRDVLIAAAVGSAGQGQGGERQIKAVGGAALDQRQGLHRLGR